MGFFFIWLALSIVAGVLASNKGRSGFGFFVLSLLLSPLVGLIAAAVASPNVAKVEEAQVASGDSKKCPFCAELIKREAIVCRFCNRELQSTAPVEPVSARAPEPPPTHDELMARYSISHDGEKYIFKGQRYTKLDDAVAYARYIQSSERTSL